MVLSSLRELFSILAAAFQGSSPDSSFCPTSQSRAHRSLRRSQKGPVAGVLLGLRQERMFCADFLGVGEDMGEAGLPVHSDPVIGCIPVAHQRSGKVLSEDGLGHVGRPMPVDMKEGEVFIPCKPYKMPHPVTAPGGFIGMDHVGDPDLLPQILIDRRTPCRCFAVEPEGGGRNKLKAEQLPEQLRRFSIGNPDPIA